jgi:hypothetical protein
MTHAVWFVVGGGNCEKQFQNTNNGERLKKVLKPAKA